MIRHAEVSDREAILRLYENARRFMHTHGNPTQWVNGYPVWDMLAGDIARRELYVMTDGNVVYGVFLLTGKEEPTYAFIHGHWRTNSPYGTIHRICGDGARRGVLSEAFHFAASLYPRLRVDTHDNNLPMQRAVLRCGFRFAGVIRLENGDPRVAYEWQADE